MFKLPIDHFSYNLFVWNFAVVGVTAIFYQHGISPSVTQGYLVCTSVIMAFFQMCPLVCLLTELDSIHSVRRCAKE